MSDPKYVVQMVNAYTREVIETEDEVFDNEQDANDYACQCNSNFAAGADSYGPFDEGYQDPEDTEYIVQEIDD
jgi:hypothetical protein